MGTNVSAWLAATGPVAHRGTVGLIGFKFVLRVCRDNPACNQSCYCSGRECVNKVKHKKYDGLMFLAHNQIQRVEKANNASNDFRILQSVLCGPIARTQKLVSR